MKFFAFWGRIFTFNLRGRGRRGKVSKNSNCTLIWQLVFSFFLQFPLVSRHGKTLDVTCLFTGEGGTQVGYILLSLPLCLSLSLSSHSFHPSLMCVCCVFCHCLWGFLGLFALDCDPKTPLSFSHHFTSLPLPSATPHKRSKYAQ